MYHEEFQNEIELDSLLEDAIDRSTGLDAATIVIHVPFSVTDGELVECAKRSRLVDYADCINDDGNHGRATYMFGVGKQGGFKVYVVGV